MQHEDMNPKQRVEGMKEFKLRNSLLLITTDHLALNEDVKQASSLVINFDFPTDLKHYEHRLSHKEAAVSFVTTEEIPVLREVESRCLGALACH
jgi:superfamily II DNA/RNA helicase